MKAVNRKKESKDTSPGARAITRIGLEKDKKIVVIFATSLCLFFILFGTFILFADQIPFSKTSVSITGRLTDFTNHGRFQNNNGRGSWYEITPCATYIVFDVTYLHCERIQVRSNSVKVWQDFYEKQQDIELFIDPIKPNIAKFSHLANYNSGGIFFIGFSGIFLSGILLSVARFYFGIQRSLLFLCLYANHYFIFGFTAYFIFLVPDDKFAFRAGLMGIIFLFTIIPIWLYQIKLEKNHR